jgi:hypothetical protein
LDKIRSLTYWFTRFYNKKRTSVEKKAYLCRKKSDKMETMVIQVKDKQDVRKLRQISADNGWQVQSSSDMLRWLIDNAPQDVPLTDDDIMDEIRQMWQK